MQFETPREISVASWLDCLDQRSAETIRSIFGDKVPSLANVDLHEVRLFREGPTIELRFDLAAFPTPAPAKWEAQEFNRVQLKLAAVGVSEVELSGVETECVLDMQITQVGSLVKVTATGSAVKIKIAADSLHVPNISAYFDGSKEAC